MSYLRKMFFVIIVLALIVCAAVKGKFSISGDYSNVIIGGDYSAYESSRTTLGFRIYPNDRLGIGISGGMTYSTGVKIDTALMQGKIDPKFNAILGCELVYEILTYEKSYFALLVKPYFEFSKIYLSEQNINNQYEYKTTKYLAVSPALALSLEPAYIFDTHFSLFTNFGLSIYWKSAEKYIDHSDPAYNFDAGNFPLATQKDSRVFTWIGYWALGVRYFF